MEHTDYYVALVGKYGANVAAGPFGTRAEAAAVCLRFGGAEVGRVHRPWPTSPVPSGTASAGGAALRPACAVVSAAELREAWAQGRVYRW